MVPQFPPKVNQELVSAVFRESEALQLFLEGFQIYVTLRRWGGEEGPAVTSQGPRSRLIHL